MKRTLGVIGVLSLGLAQPLRADLTTAQALGLGLTVDTLVNWTNPSNGHQYSIRVEFLGETNDEWSYRITEQTGSKDLSHWLLELDCELDDGTELWEHVLSGDPSAGFELGVDGSTGFTGAKWNTGAGFTTGVFKIKMDDSYAATDITVLGKGGPIHGTSLIAGPDCAVAIPAPAAGFLVLMGLSLVSSLRRRLS